jgi:hypothetical protein
MNQTKQSQPLVFNYTVKIPKAYFPYIWKRWNDLSTWNEWDNSLEQTMFSNNGLILGKTFQVIPKMGQGPVTVCVTSFIDGAHFTTSSHGPVGAFYIGHSLVENNYQHTESVIEHTICVQPNNYDFFKENIWENLKKNISESVNNLVAIATKEQRI